MKIPLSFTNSWNEVDSGDSAVDEEELNDNGYRREPERPIVIHNGLKERPRKDYQPASVENVAPVTRMALIEVMNNPDADQWYQSISLHSMWPLFH